MHGTITEKVANFTFIDFIQKFDTFRPPGIQGRWKYFFNTVGTALPMKPIKEIASILASLPLQTDIIMSEEMPPEKYKLQTHKFTMIK